MFSYETARSKRRFSLLFSFLVAIGGIAGVQSLETTYLSLNQFANATDNDMSVTANLRLSPSGDIVVQVIDVPELVSFVVIQAHVHERNLTMTYENSSNCQRSDCTVSGSNIGLVLDATENNSLSVVLSIEGNTTAMQDVLIGAVAYRKQAPTPGGCNMEFETENAPYQKLRVNDATVSMEAQAASAPSDEDVPCGSTPIKLTLYRMYLPEGDFTQETYFATLQKMMTVRDIKTNGRKILPPLGASPVRRVFGAYPGTGSIYAIVATYDGYSSAYVPAATYACSPLTNLSSCGQLNTTIAKAVCGIVLVIGFIITFIGHKCLGFEVVFLGALCGGTISFAVLNAFWNVSTSTSLGIVLGLSVLSGIGWLILTVWLNKGCITTFLSSITLGFFVASTLYFGIADDTSLFESDVNFWLIYTGVTLLVPIVLAVLPFRSNVVCCGILGAYCIVLPIDYYAGSNLKYIVINTLRRATMAGFNLAVIQPPFQYTDKWLVAFLVLLALFGIYVQMSKLGCCPCGRGENRTTVYWSSTRPILSEPRSGRRVFGESDRVQYWDS